MELPPRTRDVSDGGSELPVSGTSRPVVERVAGWSARHRKTMLLGWLLLVAGAVVTGNMLGTKTIPSYDPGQAGQAERVLNRPDVIQQPTETVLIQARSRGRTVANDPELLRTAAQVAAALRNGSWRPCRPAIPPCWSGKQARQASAGSATPSSARTSGGPGSRPSRSHW